MKIRTDFVTNSSSASFILKDKTLITEQQKQMIIHHHSVAELLNEKNDEFESYGYTDERGKWCGYGSWNIIESDKSIMGETSMDNFPMQHFMEQVGIDINLFDWDHS